MPHIHAVTHLDPVSEELLLLLLLLLLRGSAHDCTCPACQSA
jgi:hypothetical protein